jgi:hypothetical protein
MKKTVLLSYLSTLALTILLAKGLLAAHSGPPDLTQGGKKTDTYDWTLGPTGARGWAWGRHCQTSDSRQILITKVAPGSPTEGVLQEGDVLLGVDGKPFQEDARLRFARAVTEAEKEENRGILRLIRWREGRTQNVEIKLAVMGTYSATAPYDCPKSKRILDLGCRAIAKSGWKDDRGNIQVSIENDLKALALLASGREEYSPLVAEYARKVADHKPGGHISWGYAYGIRMAGVELLSRLRIREGMPLCVDLLNEHRWGREFPRAARALAGYGGAAKEMLPRLEKETREITKKEGQKQSDAFEQLIAAIKADKEPKPVRTMAEFVRRP